MKAAFLVESFTGNTWKAAEKIASKLAEERWSIIGMDKVGSPNLQAIQDADLMLIGTWVHGLFVVGQAPWAANKISNLPTMRGKRAATFLTFGLNPGNSAERLDDAVASCGARVIGGLAMNRFRLDEHTDTYVERLLDALAPTP